MALGHTRHFSDFNAGAGQRHLVALDPRYVARGVLVLLWAAWHAHRLRRYVVVEPVPTKVVARGSADLFVTGHNGYLVVVSGRYGV